MNTWQHNTRSSMPTKVLLVEYIKDSFSWKDFREDGKCRREKWKENIFGRCLVGGKRGENIGGARDFLPDSTKMFSPQNEEKAERKTLTVWSRQKYPCARAHRFVVSLLVLAFFFFFFLWLLFKRKKKKPMGDFELSHLQLSHGLSFTVVNNLKGQFV